MSPPLPREFYLRGTLLVARDLLGKELVRRTPEGETAGIIVETEAYRGLSDRGSHAFHGRVTPRTAVMYLPGGRAYVYLVYGLHVCLNVTVGDEKTPECVLVRALQPTEGVELMRRRRGLAATAPEELLASGPGKLCKALAVDLALYGADLCGDILFVREGREVADPEVAVSPRVGIDYAAEARLFPWRFYLSGNRFVSKVKFSHPSVAGD